MSSVNSLNFSYINISLYTVVTISLLCDHHRLSAIFLATDEIFAIMVFNNTITLASKSTLNMIIMIVIRYSLTIGNSLFLEFTHKQVLYIIS